MYESLSELSRGLFCLSKCGMDDVVGEVIEIYFVIVYVGKTRDERDISGNYMNVK